jgi:hypothetical protein
MTIESVARVETVIASGVGSKTVIARSEATKQFIVTMLWLWIASLRSQ